ncbi:type IV secretory system conjugative DNA transfer family protein [Telmatospirillum sp. J64-1]|uniref:type IV secretory system conjugative DNA transfer family protein n=1 Tax=Telmatospirillum sp. J64-1 TaxID=2502183 RepID=UPI00115C7BB9|nr:type IV secretory system conjugative DNA transfer family protein [Telmatospirillum sp. J64-1]
MIYRLSLLAIFAATLGAILLQWHLAVGFNAADPAWWQWVISSAVHPAGLPAELTRAMFWTGAGGIVAMLVLLTVATRAQHRTIAGDRSKEELHGSARWAKKSDAKATGLLEGKGVVVGGWQGLFGTKTLRHDGPEHVMAFAPTRSGKGVSLILPTLLTWTESVFVLDIKGENFALSAGWRASLGHRILKFEPTAQEGSVRFNPLAEIRLGDGREIADCQNIAAMVIDPDGKGLKDYWAKEGWSWLSVILLHVLYRIQRDEGRTASFEDVNNFVSGITAEDEGEDNFTELLDDMIAFEHGVEHVDKEVRRGATRMKMKAPQERSGVHSSAITELALYADPIIARNTATSDFRLADLMEGDKPVAFYLVVAPSNIDRLRPLTRIIVNLMMRRLTERMEFEGGRSVASYKNRLLLMLDEFTSIGKLEIFERALAFIAGYGLKAFIIVQDISQLQQAYGRDESIMSNCHVRVAFAPNKIETAKVLSDMAGRTTVIQKRSTRSGRRGEIGSVNESLHETGRPLLTPDECMRLRLIGSRKRWFGLFGKKVAVPGEALTFVAGAPPIRGRQALYFQDKELRRRAAIPAPIMGDNSKKEGEAA